MRITLKMSDEESQEIIDLARRLAGLEEILEELKDQLEDVKVKLEKTREEL